MKAEAIEMIIEPRDRQVGSGSVRRLLPFAKRRMVGPFIFLDVIGPETLSAGQRIDIDAHPHIGLSTVTYLISGSMDHRDSTGAVQTILPGAVNWMSAGTGVSHTERVSASSPLAMFGLQTWVALPDDQEDAAASFHHTPSAEVPVLQRGESSIRIAAGNGWRLESPVPVSSPLVLAEVSLAETTPVPVEVDHAEIAVLALSGTVAVNDRSLATGQLAVLDHDQTARLSGAGRAIVLGGDPVGTRHIWWNFVHSKRDRIEDAKRAWRSQDFPQVPGDHEPFVPLPGD